MANMLTLTDCVVIFTQPELAATIRRLRPSHYPTLIVETLLNQEHATHWATAFIFQFPFIVHRVFLVFLPLFSSDIIMFCLFYACHFLPFYSLLRAY